jgi:hypothetical protein
MCLDVVYYKYVRYDFSIFKGKIGGNNLQGLEQNNDTPGGYGGVGGTPSGGD